MARSNDERYAMWIMLQDVPGVGPARLKKLHDTAGSLEGILSLIEEAAADNDWAKTVRMFTLAQDISKYKEIVELTYAAGGKICSLDDPEYPANLRLSRSAPSVLYYVGSLERLSQRSLALVGTLTPSDLGERRAAKFARLCVANNIQVISGLARGIDTMAHKTALSCGGITYAVVAHGIDCCYPSENQFLFDEIVKAGAVISQFPTGTKPARWQFPARNETMCTLSSGTVIIEAHEKCGSIIQARYSFKHNRRVFLLNSNITDTAAWAKKLVEEGAMPIKSFNTVCDTMVEITGDFSGKGEQIMLPVHEKNPRAVLFDLDGVLYNSLSVMRETFQQVIREARGEPTPLDEQILAQYLNNAPPYVLKKLGITRPDAYDLYKRIYQERIKRGIPFYQVSDIINRLVERGYKLGIVTSQPLSRYKAIIANASFACHIQVAITWNDVPRDQAKPHPAGILKALERLQVLPADAIYIGDDAKDVQAAKRAGVHSVAATWGASRLDELLGSNPDHIADGPSDIITIVNSIFVSNLGGSGAL